jgi:acyl-CoA thioester hydrolase
MRLDPRMRENPIVHLKIRPMNPHATPQTVSQSFSWPARVYYEDTDAGGVVYYANYLKFFERCRTEWMRHLGFDQGGLAREQGVLFVVAGLEVKYIRPARLDDALAIEAQVVERLAGSLVFEQRAMRGEELLCWARVKIACVDAERLRPTRLPAVLLAALIERMPASAPPAA